MNEVEELKATIERLINPIYDRYKNTYPDETYDRARKLGKHRAESLSERDEMEKEFLGDLVTYMDEILDAFREYEQALEYYE